MKHYELFIVLISLIPLIFAWFIYYPKKCDLKLNIINKQVELFKKENLNVKNKISNIISHSKYKDFELFNEISNKTVINLNLRKFNKYYFLNGLKGISFIPNNNNQIIKFFNFKIIQIGTLTLNFSNEIILSIKFQNQDDLILKVEQNQIGKNIVFCFDNKDSFLGIVDNGKIINSTTGNVNNQFEYPVILESDNSFFISCLSSKCKNNVKELVLNFANCK